MSAPDLSALIQGATAPPSADTQKILQALGQLGMLLEILVRFEVGFSWEEIKKDLSIELKTTAGQPEEES